MIPDTFYEMDMRDDHEVDKILWHLNAARRYLRVALDTASDLDYASHFVLDRFTRREIADAMLSVDNAIANIYDRGEG